MQGMRPNQGAGVVAEGAGGYSPYPDHCSTTVPDYNGASASTNMNNSDIFYHQPNTHQQQPPSYGNSGSSTHSHNNPMETCDTYNYNMNCYSGLSQQENTMNSDFSIYNDFCQQPEFYPIQ